MLLNPTPARVLMEYWKRLKHFLPDKITAEMKRDALGTVTFILTSLILNAALIIIAIHASAPVTYSIFSIVCVAGFVYIYIWLRK